MKTYFVVISILLSGVCGKVWADTEISGQREFFEAKIRPVLVKHCYRCHSVESGKAKGGLQLDSRNGWQVGGDSGPAVVAGQPEQSPLFLAISASGELSSMPPDSRLSADVVKDFKKWIADGAVDPRKGVGPVRERTTIDVQAGRSFWAFQPRRTFSEAHAIDDFVQPQAPPAAPDKLVRRLFLDLIGLPPTPEERREFLRLYHEQSPAEAVRSMADTLLARQAFGEKWARHWLDVVRYADSNGGDFNLTFPEAWRYRNYVIDAFNDDLPYDQFLREQVAGDLLPFDTAEQRNRQLIATGFLMVSPKMLTERNKAKMHLDIADEQVDTLGRAIMGLTLGCARCHDHKFDPIPTADYYALAGILHSTRTADGILMGNVNVSGWTDTDLAVDSATRKLVAAHQAKVKRYQVEIEQKKQQANQAPQELGGILVDNTAAELSGPWRKSTYRPNHVGDHYLATDQGKGPYAITWKAAVPKAGKYELRVSFGGGKGLARKAPYEVLHAGGETRLIIDQTVKPAIDGLFHPIGTFRFDSVVEVRLTDHDAGGAVIADAIQLVHEDDLKKQARSPRTGLNTEIKRLEAELKKLQATAPQLPKAMAAQDNTDERLGDMHLRIRGETENLGRKVARGFLQVASTDATAKPQIPAGQSGRLQLAQWLTHADHPLTARVMVNRIWQQLFGRGIVATSDNFGTRGEKPSHPELLDYLAEEFVNQGWSTKHIIQKIVSSRTYQQAVLATTDDDPENLRLKRQNRRPAPAETMRDSMLAIAGQLDRERRETVVAQLGMYAIQTSGKRHESLGQTGELRQRSVYLPMVRGAVPPSLAVFDLPNPDLVTGRRAMTNVPAQALFMMNSPFVRDMAQSVSARYADEDLALEDLIQRLYQRILIRDADAEDVSAAKAYIEHQTSDGDTSQQAAVASFVQILFSSTEFRFVE